METKNISKTKQYWKLLINKFFSAAAVNRKRFFAETYDEYARPVRQRHPRRFAAKQKEMIF